MFEYYEGEFLPIEKYEGPDIATNTGNALLESRREGGIGDKPKGGDTGSNSGNITTSKTQLGDNRLIREAYDNTEVIFSEDFMSRSINYYSFPPRLGRELIQNFIDANTEKGTLNGVKIDFIDRPGPTIKIRGDREFADPTALYSLDSDKGDDNDNAGGNGIGLKQVALVMFKQYGIKDFIIRGKKRTVRYRLLSKEEINKRLEEKEIKKGDEFAQVKKGWFVAEVIDETDRQEPREWNEYEIVCDPDNESSGKLYEDLQGMKNYGVHNDNPLLEGIGKDPAEGGFYKIDKGGFKILDNPLQQGAIFINGQRFQYNRMDNAAGTDDLNVDELYWGGPLGMTLYITTAYDISIDRPALNSSNTNNDILYPLIKGLDIDSIESVLINTETIWKNLITKNGITEYYNYRYRNGNTSLIEHLIYEIVERISKDGEATKNFYNKYLAPSSNAKIIACDIKDPSKIIKLQTEGYTLIPEYFNKLGVPYASSYLPPDSTPSFDHKTILTQTETQARNHGVEVQYSETVSTYQLRTLDDIYAYLLQALGKCNTLYNNDSKILGIVFKDNIAGKTDLFSSRSTRKMRDIRTLFVLGLTNKLFDSFSLYYQGDRVTFTYHNEELFARLQETDRHTDDLVIEVGSKNFSPDKIEARKKHQLKKKGDDNRVSNDKDVNRNKSGFARRWTYRVAILCCLLGVGYSVNKIVSKSPLERLSSKYNQADVPSKSSSFGDFREGLKGELRQLFASDAEEPDDPVEDMVIVEKMSDIEVQKFELLKKYVKITLGIEVKEECFIFEGKGAKGVNIGKASIGLHTSMMKNDVDFFEALKTFLHEMAHSNPSATQHDNTFRHTNEGLDMATIEKYHDLVNAMRDGEKETLTSDEEFIIHIEDYRDSIGKQ